MKLIDKDALVVEIERIKGMYCYDKKTNASFVAKAVINSINNAINSIEVKDADLQEEPKTNWLQELQERLDSLSKEDFDKVWAKYRRYGEEESVSEDLENAALEYATHYDKNWSDVKDGYIAENEIEAFKAGAEWQKEQMMAKAVDGEILETEDNDGAICSHTHLELFIEPNTLEENCFKDNDKVKVIVIKED